MSINLVYPITRTHEHLAMRDDKSVIAFYRIPNTPITITDAEKKTNTKSQSLKWLKN